MRYLFYLPTYLLTLHPHSPCTLPSFCRRVFPIYDPLPPRRSLSTAVCPFGYNPRPFSISHCRTSSNPLASHFYFIPFFLAGRLVLFSHSSYLIGHFVLHRPRYYRGNSRTKRRATGYSHNGTFR